MSNDLVIYNAGAEMAVCTPKGKNYQIATPMGAASLLRDTDFGVIPKTKQPTLFKSGAEKICMAYKLFQNYAIESKIENYSDKGAFFYYLVRCDLKTIVNGEPITVISAYGSANTSEKRNGFNSPADSANATIKMAQKRALTAAALSISGLSSMFTQDMENESFMANGADLIKSDDPESPVSAKQIKRLYAIGGDIGITAAELKQFLAAQGYASTKDIKQKDYDHVIDLIKSKGENK